MQTERRVAANPQTKPVDLGCESTTAGTKRGYFYEMSNIVYLAWRGVVVSGVRRMNEVNARRARLLPGWVTVFGWVYRLGI